jgi:predicted SPOUT superfamily RNA methylase MTH1
MQYPSRIHVLLPNSLLQNETTNLLKTLKIGNILRTLTMFRIPKCIFYDDNASVKEIEFIIEVIKYVQCPPYLRKHIKPSPNLRHAAVLPPIHAPNHTSIRDNAILYISGQIMEKKGDSIKVDIGKENPIILKYMGASKPGQEVIIKYDNTFYSVQKPFEKTYWKTSCEISSQNIEALLNDNSDFFVIGASKSGEQVSRSILKPITFQKAVFIAFGPIKGSFKKYIKNPDVIDQWINFIPNQATKTVKIEEALHSSLSILNYFLFNVK